MILARKRLVLRQQKLEGKLKLLYFNRGRGSLAQTSDANAAGGTTVDEPDGPDMQQQYKTLYGMCHL